MNDAIAGRYGYIEVNQLVIADIAARGITVAKFTSLSTCDLGNLTSYDTSISSNNSKDLRDWLASLEEGSIVIGLSADESSREIDPARGIFASMGVDIVAIGFRWRFAFIIQVGSPHLSKQLLEPPGNPAIITADICMYISYVWDFYKLQKYTLHVLAITIYSYYFTLFFMYC